MPSPAATHHDVVVVGGGHNGLTAAAYLARAGLSVLVLERLDHVGGAAVSAPAFAGWPTRLSRYSYLVSLLPAELITELELDVRLVSRSVASYTPTLAGTPAGALAGTPGGTPGGLLVEHDEGPATRESFRALTGSDEAYAAWVDFYADVADLARVVAPTLLEPLPRERDLRDRIDPVVWADLVERPLGQAIERRFTDDTVRGVVATDALIGTFASLGDASLVQNRCFLYHLIGNGTGEWRVPVGGMGAVTTALTRAATRAGAQLLTGAEVTSIRGAGGSGDSAVSGEPCEVTWTDASGEHTAAADFVLSGAAPWVLDGLLGGAPSDRAAKPTGSQLKINLLLSRLPRLRSGIDPAVAFAGTLHLGEDYSSLEQAYADAAAGRVPTDLPGEVYCHSLTDPSILGEVPAGTHTLTYFGLHTPAELFAADPVATKQLAVDRALASLQAHLAEPLAGCLAHDATGAPCIEAKIPQELEADLRLPGGHIFHGDLSWPWESDDAVLDTPARRWGVEASFPGGPAVPGGVLLCGAGARRGGAVSGLGGLHAARAVLELR